MPRGDDTTPPSLVLLFQELGGLLVDKLLEVVLALRLLARVNQAAIVLDDNLVRPVKRNKVVQRLCE